MMCCGSIITFQPPAGNQIRSQIKLTRTSNLRNGINSEYVIWSTQQWDHGARQPTWWEISTFIRPFFSSQQNAPMAMICPLPTQHSSPQAKTLALMMGMEFPFTEFRFHNNDIIMDAKDWSWHQDNTTAAETTNQPASKRNNPFYFC